MFRFFAIIVCILMVAACDKHDPILPGERTAVFASSSPNILNIEIPNLPDNLQEYQNSECPYTQDSSNVIRDGNRKIFSGFSSPNSVKSAQKPVCSGNFVYAGLTTGELVKINAKTRAISWVADIYSPSNMTGGASVVDITAPIILSGKYVFAGGLGDAFCKINATSGAKVWCDKIGVAVPFIVMDDVSFVLGTDNFLYAIRNTDGAVFWRSEVKKQVAPTYANGIITVGKQRFDAKSGNNVKK